MAGNLKKWIFRFREEIKNVKNEKLLTVIKDNSLQIIDNNLPKMVLVKGTDEEIESANEIVFLPDYSIEDVCNYFNLK